MGITAQDVISVMQGWVGKSRSAGTHRDIIDLYNSYTPRARGYKVTYSDEYCDTTVSAAFIKLGAIGLIGGPECGVENHVQLFKKAGIWQEDGTIKPEPGYIIVYNWDDSTQPNDGAADHIGIVESVSSTSFTTIEGNMNGGIVGRRTIKVGYGYIRGYAIPRYAKSGSGGNNAGNSSSRKKSVLEVAQEAIAGKWGNGEERKQRITAAGYDYSTVQSKINSLLKGQGGGSTTATYYTVQKGDTLSGIARKYGTTYQKIVKLNGISNPDIISIGQKIRIK